MTEYDAGNPPPEHPTASAVRRFLENDYLVFENALDDVRVSLAGGYLHDKRPADTNWGTIQGITIARCLPEIPENMLHLFWKIDFFHQLIYEEFHKLTRRKLHEARQDIHELLLFLHNRFPAAGVVVPLLTVRPASKLEKGNER